jgi:hypothetical protein
MFSDFGLGLRLSSLDLKQIHCCRIFLLKTQNFWIKSSNTTNVTPEGYNFKEGCERVKPLLW